MRERIEGHVAAGEREAARGALEELKRLDPWSKDRERHAEAVARLEELVDGY